MSDNHPYLNFDEYIRQGEPGMKERADAWRVAIGLQAVDGLRVSDYLRNRYLHIHPTEEWSMQPNMADPTSTPTSSGQPRDKFTTNNQMKHIQYPTQGTCSVLIDVTADDNDIIQQVFFLGGCNGNTQGICRLVTGQKIDDVISKLNGIRCGNKTTSCPDQLCRALEQLKKQK